MKIILFILAYIVIASAAIAGFVLMEYKMDSEDERCLDESTFAPHIIFGFLWPITLLPCLAYIAARWYIENHEE